MTDVNQELEQAKQNIRGLTAQLDATKMLFNDTVNGSLQFRASCIIFQQDLQEKFREIANLKADLAKKDVEIDDLTNRLVAANTQLSALNSDAHLVAPDEMAQCQAA